MSRTYAHKPIKLLIDENYDYVEGINHEEFRRHENTKCQNLERWSRRKVRHSLIDEEDVELTNSISERNKMSYLARNIYW